MLRKVLAALKLRMACFGSWLASDNVNSASPSRSTKASSCAFAAQEAIAIRLCSRSLAGSGRLEAPDGASSSEREAMASYLRLDSRMTGRPGSGVFLFLHEISVRQYHIGAFCLILYRFYVENIF